MMHYMIAQDTPKGFVESYEITSDFFIIMISENDQTQICFPLRVW